MNLGKLKAGMKSLKVSCSASVTGSGKSSSSKTYETSADVKFLPKPSGGGSVTKQDFKTGALLVRSPSTSKTAPYEPILPFGFYTSFSDYLGLNLSIVDNVKASG